MKNLIYVKQIGENYLVNTSDLWAGFGYKEHRTFKRVVSSHEVEFIERGVLASVDAETKANGRPEKSYLLNERQFILLCLLVKNTPQSIKIKSAIEREFNRIRKELARIKEQRLSVDWQEARANSKCIRSTLTKSIDALGKLADQQGGEKNRHYYDSVTKMIYKELFGDSSLTKVRDSLSRLQLQFLTICEESCADEISRLVELEIDYHQIYAECKKRVIHTVDGLSASKLKSPNLIKLAWENKKPITTNKEQQK